MFKTGVIFKLYIHMFARKMISLIKAVGHIGLSIYGNIINMCLELCLSMTLVICRQKYLTIPWCFECTVDSNLTSNQIVEIKS